MENYSQRYLIRQLCNKNTRRVAILGNGIVSTLAQKLLKDSIVLTKRKTDIFLGHVFFHDTIENRLMLHLFGINFTSKNIPVYYYDEITQKYTKDVTDEIRKQIAREKMGDPTKEVVLSNMTDEQPDFVNLLFNEQKLITHLISGTENIVLYPEKIDEFDDYVRFYFEDGLYIDFEYVINTIPQPFFSLLVGDTQEFKYEPLVFVTTELDYPDHMIYSYNNCFWKRQFIKNKTLCIEFDKKDFTEELFQHEFPEIKNYKINEIPYGRLLSSPVQDSNRIKHVGRFAQWDHRITTDNAINKLIKLNL